MACKKDTFYGLVSHEEINEWLDDELGFMLKWYRLKKSVRQRIKTITHFFARICE